MSTTKKEDREFDRYAPLERQCMYARGVCYKKVVGVFKLREILKKKFGACKLTLIQLRDVIGYYKERI